MSQLLVSVLSFLVAIGVLVAVHEYGHYWVARRLGVRVLRYSIGFGHRVFGWTSRKTGIEYWLSALPLGGYVKMLDEREAPVAEADKPFAFNRVHPWRRIAIVAAGPGVNVLFAILAYWLVFMIGVAGIKPMIGAAPADSLAAQVGLRAGDEIIAGAAALPTRPLPFSPVRSISSIQGRARLRISPVGEYTVESPSKTMMFLPLF